MSFHMELACCEDTICEMVADKRVSRKLVSDYYAMAIVSSWPTDWQRINVAIRERWGLDGLDRVKRAAWRIVDARGKAGAQ